MKDGVILVNTSRGGLIKTADLIQGIRDGKFFAVGLDVYEEETGSVYEDMSDQILGHSTMARLLSFPNVMVTSHQGFFTREAVSYTHLAVRPQSYISQRRGKSITVPGVSTLRNQISRFRWRMQKQADILPAVSAARHSNNSGGSG